MTKTELQQIESKLIKEGVPVDEATALAVRVYNFALMNQVSIEDVIYHMEITKK